MKKIRIGINGFGRIGRVAARIIFQRPAVELAAINSRSDSVSHAYLLKYDSTYGTFPNHIEGKGDTLLVDNHETRVYQKNSPDEIPWEDAGVDVVIDSTGTYRTAVDLEGHLKSGVKKVILSSPAKDDIKTVILGVNDASIDFANTAILSNSSCTTNALATTLKVLDDAFGVENGFMTTIHAVTDSQNILDNSHKKEVRLRRAAFASMIPAATGSAKDIGKIFPHLEGKLMCQAIRVPLLTVSLITLTVQLKQNVNTDTIHTSFMKSAKSTMKGILGVSEEELVSKDYVKSPYSSIVDTYLTKVIEPSCATIYAWYDNEYGYTSRLIDLVELAGKGI